MKYLLYFLLVFLIPHSSPSQPKINVDSLVKVAISRANHPKIIAVSGLDSLLKLLPVTTSPADRIKIIYEIIDYSNHPDWNEQLNYEKKVLAETIENNDKIGEAVILAETGYNVVQDGSFDEGSRLIFSALKIAEKTGNDQAIGIVYDNLGVCYKETPNLRRLYIEKALKYSIAAGDKLFTCYELGNMTSIFLSQHKIDSAQNYLLKAFQISVTENFAETTIIDLIRLGDIQTDSEKGLKYFRTALNMQSIKLYPRLSSWALTGIAATYRKMGQTDSALFYAKKAYNLSKSLAIIERIAPAQLLVKIYNERNADSTLKYTNVYYAARDSMYSINKMQRTETMAFADQQRQRDMDDEKAAYQTSLRFYLLAVVIAFLLLIAFIFWRNNRQNKQANQLLTLQKEQIENTLQELKLTQTQLIQSEKMASLGELTAGIAHEIQNPLNFVNNFSEINIELVEEMELELSKGDKDEAISIAADIKQNLEKINLHGKRADSIVKGMLQHSRSSSGVKEPTAINELADEYLRLTYHGLRAKDKSFNATLETDFDPAITTVNINPQDIGRVILNLLTNGFYSVSEKKKLQPNGYEPTVTINTKLLDDGKMIEIGVMDNGMGIPQNVLDKIYQPFFTTKPTGQGTGLGLSMSYDIVKAHGGELRAETAEGEYTMFTIILPLS